MTDIVVIGAGIAGLACASELAGAGRTVRLVDKGRGPGGRMATRRAEMQGKTLSFDHGAQYFTARDPRFRQQVEAWEQRGVAAPWPEAGEDAWIGTPAMNAPIRALAANCEVTWNCRAQSVTFSDGRWRIATDDGSLKADTLLVAIPAEQAETLLQDAAPDLAAIAGQVRSEPCWAAMAAFARPLDLPDIVRAHDAPIRWAARNSAKGGRCGEECWVIHASPERSRELLDLSKEEVGPLLLEDLMMQTGTARRDPVHLAAHRWLYAMPAAIEGEPARYDTARRIGIAGDYLHSPRVEGAWLSGKSLAAKVLREG